MVFPKMNSLGVSLQASICRSLSLIRFDDYIHNTLSGGTQDVPLDEVAWLLVSPNRTIVDHASKYNFNLKTTSRTQQLLKTNPKQSFQLTIAPLVYAKVQKLQRMCAMQATSKSNM